MDDYDIEAAYVPFVSELRAGGFALEETTENSVLAVRIVDAGTVVRDESIPIGALMKGNATFHLHSHLEQLRTLRR